MCICWGWIQHYVNAWPGFQGRLVNNAFLFSEIFAATETFFIIVCISE